MNKEILPREALNAEIEGVFLGGLEPEYNENGTWSEVYFYKEKIINIFYYGVDVPDIIFAHELSLKELSNHVVHYKTALELMNS